MNQWSKLCLTLKFREFLWKVWPSVTEASSWTNDRYFENVCALFTLILIGEMSLSLKVSEKFSSWWPHSFYNCWKIVIIGLSMLMTYFVTVWNEIDVKLKLEIQRLNQYIRSGRKLVRFDENDKKGKKNFLQLFRQLIFRPFSISTIQKKSM